MELRTECCRTGSSEAEARESSDWQQLQVLYIQGNSFQGSLPEEIGKLTDLRYLNASSNQISGTVPPSIGNMQAHPPSQVGAPCPRTHLLPM